MKDKEIDYCGKGIYEQIKNNETNVFEYSTFTTEDLQKAWKYICEQPIPKSKQKGFLSGKELKKYYPNKFEYLEDDKLYIVEL